MPFALITQVLIAWLSLSIEVVLFYNVLKLMGGGMMVRGYTYEIHDGLIFIYYQGHLSHILSDNPALRADLEAKGYKMHNKYNVRGVS
jgi:hypothetical protein